ncbi:MAG: M14 family metallocarboxypeptidase [Eubacteriales bacterium]|nr:M14 family metallocarboxypeptidase [Eubacteriales bacterium]
MKRESRYIVPTDIVYSSAHFICIVKRLVREYPFIKYFVIGKSLMGTDLVGLSIGAGRKQIFYSGAFHGNEWLTTPVLLRFLEEYAYHYRMGRDFYGIDAVKLFKEYTLFVVPMVNPDGVDFAGCYPQWKANGRGVDLNLQFPAGWEQAKKNKEEAGIILPGPRDFPGNAPLTEPESRAIYDFTIEHDFRLILAYHSQGREIYWKYLDYEPANSRAIAEYFHRVSGYTVSETPAFSAYAGYKDWFIMEYNRPGYTIEAGLGENPLPVSQFSGIYKDNIGIMLGGMLNV